MILFEVEVEGIDPGPDGRMPVLIEVVTVQLAPGEQAGPHVMRAVVITPAGLLEHVDMCKVRILRVLPTLTADVKEAGEKSRIALPGQAEN